MPIPMSKQNKARSLRSQGSPSTDSEPAERIARDCPQLHKEHQSTMAVMVLKAFAAALIVAKGPIKMRITVAAVWTALYFLGPYLCGRLASG
jgi:hypothetical protein